jgi:PAS domain S-box-containing protein
MTILYTSALLRVEPTNMGTPLRVLLIEDSESDAQLVLRELRRGGYEPQWERVETAAALLDAVSKHGWDVILSDYVMPQFSGPAALRLVRERDLDVPVIIVSGEISQEVAVVAMKAGSHDYVMKDNLARLVPAIERELREAEGRRERRRAETLLQQSEARFRDLIEGLDAIVWEGELEPFRFTFVSKRAEAVLGFPVSRWLSDAAFPGTRLHPDDRDRVLKIYNQVSTAGGSVDFEYRFLAADGRPVWLRDIMRVVLDDRGRPSQIRGVTIDISTRRIAELQRAAMIELARELSGAFALSEVLERIHRCVTALLPCEVAATFYWDSERNAFRNLAQQGLPEALAAQAAALSFPLNHPVVAPLARGDSLVIDDLDQQPWISPDTLATYRIRALMAIPLVIGGKNMGALVACRTDLEHPFSKDQQELLESIGRQAAMAIAAAEAYRENEEAAQVSAALARVGRELISSLDQPVLLDRLCRVTSEVLGCDFSHTFLWDGAEQAYVAVSGYGDTPEQWESLQALRTPRAVVKGLIAEVERQDITQVVMSQAQDLIPAAIPQRYGITVSLYIALRRGDEVIGIHTGGYRGREDPFSANQLRIARGIGQLASLALANARLVEEMGRANRLKSDFVATMSHELRTPLNVIMGYNELLRDGGFGPVAPEQQEVLRRIAYSAHQLLELINATLDLSRLEAGRVTLDRKLVRLPELMRELADEAHELEAKADVQLEWNIAPNLPAILSDRVKLKVVLKNLLANALKFTDHGSVSVRAKSREGGVEITVTDTGIGIAPDALPVIFEPFRQADSSTTRKYAGVGLGLYIARRLLDMLGGAIEVESTPHQGSTFRVWVPGRESRRKPSLRS